MSDNLHSHHIFIFPFKWEMKTASKKDFAARTNINLIRNLAPENFKTGTSIGSWKCFSFDWTRDYSEAIYFNGYTRDVLFDRGGTIPGPVLQYHIPGKGQFLKYRIQLANKKDHPPGYILSIEEITLNFYDTGIGFLCFHLDNTSYPNEKDILCINDYGRRIYPQFLNQDKPPDSWLSGPKGAFLADCIEILKDDQGITIDDFSRIPGAIKQHNDPGDTAFLLPDFIQKLLPVVAQPGGQVTVEPLLDDRMFVICWVGNKRWMRHDRKAAERLYSFIFVDGKIPGIGNRPQLEEDIRRHTYKRWSDQDLIYGITRYSFMVMTDGGWFNRNVILTHVQTMYFQIALLCLLQRGSISRFSEEIARLSQHLTQSGGSDHGAKEVESLYSKYLHFINKVYFREVTPQEQGIDLYKMVQDKMEIERDVKALQGEIQDLFNLLKLRADARQTESMNWLSILGALFIIPSFVLAVLGPNFIDMDGRKMLTHAGLYWIGAATIVCIGCTIASLFVKKRYRIVLVSGSILLLLLTLWFNLQHVPKT